MRIIRGEFKGRKILTPKGFKGRPTTDFAKEALFNILNNNYNIKNLDILDLFAGTGNISYEFLSEGCKHITAIDINKIYTTHIKTQFDKMFPGKGKVITTDVFNFCKKQNLDFDIIFADPPYEQTEKISKLPEIIFHNPSIKDNLLFILEHSKKNNFSNFEYFKESRKYGNVRFSFFEKN